MKSVRLGIIGILPSYYQDEIWRRLAAVQGLDVTVVYLSDVGLDREFSDSTMGATRHWGERIDLDAYRHVFLKNFGSQDLPGPLFRINPGLLRLLRREKFDVVLLPGHSTLSTLGVAVYCLANRTPVIYRGEAVPAPDSGRLASRLKRSLDRALLRRFDAVLYSCTRNRAFFEARDVSGDRLALIPCAVDNDFYQAEYDAWHPRREEVRARLGIGPDDVVVTFLGRLIDIKCAHEIPEVARRVTAMSPKRRVHFLIIGDGPERQRIEEAINTLRVVNVHMIGYQPQSALGQWLAASDVGLILSSQDNSPKALNEMANFRLALISTEVAGTAFDLVREGQNGHIVDVSDPETVAKHIVDMIDGDKLELYGKRSLEIVDRWSFEADVNAISHAVAQVQAPSHEVRQASHEPRAR